jgi:hypothetical protein
MDLREIFWEGVDMIGHLKGYKPEVTNPQHTKVEIFKGKVKNKITLNLCSRKIH